MELIISIFLLLLTFYLIALVCDYYFVPALEEISKQRKMSSEFAGATLMAVGSSAPELFTSLFAVLNPAVMPSLGAGTIVGSAIFNILVIIGASALVRQATITWQPVVRDLAFYSISILLLLRVFRDGQIVPWEMFLFLVLYIVYVYVAKNRRDRLGYGEPEWIEDTGEDEPATGLSGLIVRVLGWIMPDPEGKHYRWTFTISILFIGLLTHLMVESGVHIAQAFAIPPAIIGLTILAIGTSVPDLLSSLVVAKKGKGDMAITNAIGSNIFDILFGLSVPYLIYFMINTGTTSIQVENANLTGSIMLLFATVIAIGFLLVIRKRTIGRYAGIFLIILYIGYLIYTSISVLT